jgi:hypothetical protein
LGKGFVVLKPRESDVERKKKKLYSVSLKTNFILIKRKTNVS